jgi:YD repeat-containing protein
VRIFPRPRESTRLDDPIIRTQRQRSPLLLRRGGIPATDPLDPRSGAGPDVPLRRKIQWTNTGAGHDLPLRTGEPSWWETRRLDNSDDLKATVAAQTFSDQQFGILTFDANQKPSNWPRSEYAYNSNRQVRVNLYTDGAESIRSEYTYQASGFGDSDQFSRLLTATDPRQFDSSRLYTGLSFVHSYQYDAFGNLTQHAAPTVNRGTADPQIILYGWDYNTKGQVTRHVDGSGNVSTWTYNEGGPNAGGDVEAAGTFNGYLNCYTLGVEHSTDPAVSAVTAFKVNALGWVTELTDPEGNGYAYEYNALGKLIKVRPPR